MTHSFRGLMADVRIALTYQYLRIIEYIFPGQINNIVIIVIYLPIHQFAHLNS